MIHTLEERLKAVKKQQDNGDDTQMLTQRLAQRLTQLEQ
jgi:hypothetical protein